MVKKSIRLARSAILWIIRAAVLFLCLSGFRDSRSILTITAIANGDTALKRGDAAQAIPAFESALAAQPNDPLLIARLIQSYTAAKRPELAILLIRQQADLSGWTPSLHRQIADLLITLGDEREAMLHEMSALTGTNDDLPVLHQLADYAIAQHDFNTAQTWLSRILALDSANAGASYELGLLTLPTDQKSGQMYLKNAAGDPQYRTTVTTLLKASTPLAIGLTMINLGLWPYADHALTQSLIENPNDSTALAFLGIAKDHTGGDGWPLIERALRAAPDDTQVNLAAALHWEQAGDSARALDILQQAGTYDPANPAVAAQIGTIYRDQRKLDEAAYWLNLAVSLSPDTPENGGFRVLLATFYADEQYDLSNTGLQIIQNMAAKLPNDPDVRASLGEAFAATNQLDSAFAEFTKALTLDPTNIRAHYYLGAMLEARGDNTAARDDYLYIYHNAAPSNGFRVLAIHALQRLGYPLD